MQKDFKLHDGRKGAALAINVIPRAQHNEIVELSRDGTIRMRLRSPADDDAINHSLVAFLAEVLSVEPGRIEIVAGHEGRNKLVSVLDLSTEAAQERIVNLL